MCITASFGSIIGSREYKRAAERPVRLQVGWEKAGEGNPYEPAQARMQVSIHVKVVGLLLVRRGHVPARMLSRTAPGSITHRNLAGTLVCLTASGRQKQLSSTFV
jgi:hypothetical protein